jgi:hypothetical protein
MYAHFIAFYGKTATISLENLGYVIHLPLNHLKNLKPLNMVKPSIAVLWITAQYGGSSVFTAETLHGCGSAGCWIAM